MPSDATSGDADLDGSIEADASRNCSTVTNASSFTPPGEQRPHCYWFHAFPSHWLGAANTCSAEGGHLVTISSNAETTFVLGLVATFPPNEWLWIGGTDGRFSSDGPGSGPYSWVTGEPMSYTNWYTDGDTPEPDGSCKSCGGNPCYCEHRIAIRNDGRWVDGYEAIPYRYICEAD
jgi:hypothetical protein